MHDMYDLFDALLLVHSPIRNGKKREDLSAGKGFFLESLPQQKNITRSTWMYQGSI